jgi:hypothetical protein
MTTDANPNPPATELPEPQIPSKTEKTALFKVPGVVAISLYMMLLAVFTTLHVVSGHAQLLLLIFPVLFFAGALGLLLLLRWAWALTLAAVALSAGSFLWSFATQHDAAGLLQGLLNLVFFLYLVRTDVREKLH